MSNKADDTELEQKISNILKSIAWILWIPDTKIAYRCLDEEVLNAFAKLLIRGEVPCAAIREDEIQEVV